MCFFIFYSISDLFIGLYGKLNPLSNPTTHVLTLSVYRCGFTKIQNYEVCASVVAILTPQLLHHSIFSTCGESCAWIHPLDAAAFRLRIGR